MTRTAKMIWITTISQRIGILLFCLTSNATQIPKADELAGDERRFDEVVYRTLTLDRRASRPDRRT